MARSPGVTKWTKIASALYSGALNRHLTFHTTQDAIEYLHAYQAPQSVARGVDTEHCDFYYHPDDLRAPFQLGKLFQVGQVDRCLLCLRITIAVDAEGRFVYVPEFGSPAVVRPQSQEGDGGCGEPRDLARLRHLALMHTPFFLTLFLELVKNKRHVLHARPDEALDIAEHVYDVVKRDKASRFKQESGFPFLRLWWIFQERRASGRLRLSIPCYLEMLNGSCRWTPKMDSFEIRKPEPLYSFVSNKCVCCDVWPSGVEEYSLYANLSSSLETLTRAGSCTFSVRLLTPKLHGDAILESLVRACDVREMQMNGGGPVECSSVHAPRLDCLVLEDVGHPQAVVMHVVVTLRSEWQSLTSWMAETSTGDLATELKKVCVAVLGALRDTCLANKRPPRKAYARAEDLANLFFVHGETKEVLSLLPYVSIDRLHRSSNCSKDENSFRATCANLVLNILCSRGGGTSTVAIDDAAIEQWRACESGGTEELSFLKSVMDLSSTLGCSDLTAHIWNSLQFCKSGLTDPNMWSVLNPHEYGERNAIGVDYFDVWLGDTDRTPDALRNKLVAINLKEPLHVSVLEVADDLLAQVIKLNEGTEKMTASPEKHKGLVTALTIPESLPRPTGNTAMTMPQSSAGMLCSEAPRGGDCAPSARTIAKRVNEIECSSKVASKKSHRDPPSSVAASNSGGGGGGGDGAVEHASKLVISVKCLERPGRLSPRSNAGDDVKQTFDYGEGEGRSVTETNVAIYSDQEVASNREGESRPRTNSTDVGESFAGLRSPPPQHVHIDLLLLGHGDTTESAYSNGPAADESEEANGNNACLQSLIGTLIRDSVNCVDDGCFQLVASLEEDMGDSRQLDTRDQSRWGVPNQTEQCEGAQFWSADPVECDAGHPNLEQHVGESSSSNRFETPSSEPPKSQAKKRQARKQRTVGRIEQISADAFATDTVGDQEGRAADPRVRAFLDRNPRWKSNGFKVASLNEIQCVEYKTMVYRTPTEKTGAGDVVVLRSPVKYEPISSPCENLVEPRGAPSPLSSAAPAVDVARRQTSDRKLNERLGIEVSKRYGTQTLICPRELEGYAKRVAGETLNCRESPQKYRAVDLSQPPERGFRHVALEVNDFPVRGHEKPLVKIQSSQTLYLGAVCTVQDVSGLLCVRVFAKTCKLLEDLLDMHTRLQIDSFVPRVFALQLMKVPFVHEPAVGVFVGESPGEWNLGCPHGMERLGLRDKVVLAHHVSDCLLRAQMVTLEVLGFPMRCVQPARIWKRDGGFRLDALSCLVDTIQKWVKSGKRDTGDAIAHGVAAVRDTLTQLELLEHVPRAMGAVLNDTLGRSERDVFHRMYAALMNEAASATPGSGCDYKKFTLATNRGPLEPFGPFRVQIHNQTFKWNKAIVVEPLT